LSFGSNHVIRVFVGATRNSSPGPLVLTARQPENNQLKADDKYTAEVFLRDLRSAVRASKSLKKAVPVRATEAIGRSSP